MPWVKAADALPCEGEQVLVYDPERRRMELGRYAGGAWYVEDERDGSLKRIEGVTHWSPILESYLNDESEDD